MLLKRRDYRVMDWKNGKGKSAEIEICPPGAAFGRNPFIWRLSSANVVEPGPFSSFPGYERYLTLFEGRSMRLNFEGAGGESLVMPGEVIRFPGEAPVHCELPVGPVSDLNLIVRKDLVDFEFQVFKLSTKPRSFRLDGKVTFVFALAGPISASVYPGEACYQVEAGDTLRVEGPTADDERLILLEPGSAQAMVALVELGW